jgi:hypothetical protein
MINDLSNSLPNKVDELNNLKNNKTSESKAQEFSSLGIDQEIPKATKVNNNAKGDIPKTKPVKQNVPPAPIDKVAPTPDTPAQVAVGGDDPLSNLGKFIGGQVNAGQPKLMKIDLAEYAPYFGNNVSWVTDQESLDKNRAKEQSGVEQFKYASGRVALNVIPEVIAQLANVADLEDYANSDQEVGNWLNTMMKDVQESVNEELPIYRVAPDKALDYGDSAWWFENGANLTTSAMGFVGAGYLTGGASSAVLGKLGQGAKALRTLGKTNQLGHQGKQGVYALSALTNAIALNQAEGVGIGVDTYNQVYQQELDNLKADPKSVNVSEQELDKEARQRASVAASSAINFNRLNIMFNLTSAAMFLKTPLTTRTLLSAPSIKKTLGTIGLEGTQESAEELVNMFSQNQAVNESQNKQYGFKEAIADALSDEGKESALLGFIGGAGQTALTKAGKYIPMYKNSAYNKAYTEAYNKSDSSLSNEERDAIANREALTKVGTNKNRVSANYLENQRYVEQQDGLVRYSEMSATDKVNDVTNAFYSAEENTVLLNEINKANQEGDTVKATQLQDKLFTMQAYNAFELGTTEALIDLYKGYAGLTREEAEQKGLIVEGEDNYVAKANNAIKTIEALENIYVESNQFVNSSDVYFLEENKYLTNSKVTENKKKIDTLLNKAKETYVNDNTKTIANSNYVDDSFPSGINVNAFSPGFKSTPAYRRLKDLIRTDNTLRSSLVDIQNELDIVTHKDFQQLLSNRISENRKKQKKEQRAKALNKAKVASKSAVNKTIEALRAKVNNNAVEDVDTNVDTNTEVSDTQVNDVVTPLPVNDDVVAVNTNTDTTDVQTQEARVYPKTPITVAFPEFRNPPAQAWIQQVKGAIENIGIDVDSNVNFLQGVVDSFKANRDAAEVATPFDLDAIDKSIVVIEDSISRLKADKQQQLQQAEQLRELQSNFIDELVEDIVPTEEGNTENASPANKANRSANIAKAEKLAKILDSMEENGIDTSNFKDVITSFELASSKEKVISVFGMLKALYNIANDSQVEGTYEELMYSQEKQKGIIANQEELMLYSKSKDDYTSDMDNISKDIVQVYNDLARLNNLDPSKAAIGTEIYNETGSNKLAYLAKLYNVNFTPKVSKTGKPYIEVSKEDVNNLLNSMLDQRVLNPEFLQVGTEIAFVPLVSVTLEDGTIKDSTNTTVDDAPIGIQVNGETIEGLYLHDVTWLNNTNLDNSKEGIIEDQNKLRALRQLILNSKVPVKTTIINRTAGVPILDNSGEVNTVLTAMPEVEIGISRGGQIYTNEDVVVETVNEVEISEGKGVVIIPFNKKKLALPVRRSQLNNQQVDSIVNAVRLYLDNKVTPTTQQLSQEFDVNILSIKGLETYINNFIPLGNIKANTFEDFKSRLVSVADNVPKLQFSNGVLLYGYGQDIETNYISKDKNEGEEREQDLLHLRTHLQGLYNHVNLSNLKSNKAIPFIADNGEVFSPYKDYKEYAKDSMITPYLGMKLEDGTTIYTIQSRIHFDLDSIFKNTINPVEDNTNVLPTSTNTDVDTTPQEQRITLPNGKTFSFDDVTTEDFSPIINAPSDEDAELIESSSLIKGLSIGTQMSLYKSIANDIYMNLLDNVTEDGYQEELVKNVKLAVQGLELIQEVAEGRRVVSEAYARQADIINEQVSIIKANLGKVYKGVKLELNKKINIKTLNNLNTQEEVSFDEDEMNERNFYLDTLQFAIDPRTTLSKEVKQFLEGIVDKKVIKRTVNGQEVVEYKNITNLLGLNKYVSFDIIFNDLLKIMSKSNINSRLVEKLDAVSEKYGNKPAYIINMLEAIESEVETKPYLLDVVDKLSNAELHIQNAFITALNKTHTNHIFLQSTYNSSTKKYSIRANKAASRNVSNLVLSEWQNNLRTSDLVEVVDDKLVLSSYKLAQFNEVFENLKTGKTNITYDTLSNWLAQIGIELEEKVYDTLVNKGLKVGEIRLTIPQLFTLSNGMFRNMHERINNFNPAFSNPLSLEEETIFEDNAFKVLAQITSNYKSNLFTDSFKNGNGDTIYGYSNARYVTDRFVALKSNLQLLLDLKKDPFTKDSTWLNDLLIEDDLGVRINTNSVFYKAFEYSTSDSLKVKNNVIGKTIDSLTPNELEKYHLGLFFNGGQTVGKKGNATPIIRVVYPTMSDKANTFVLQVPGKYYKFNSNRKLSDADKERLVKTLIYPEIKRIKAHQERVEKTDIAAYDKGAGKFLLFPALNEVAELWNEDGTLKDEVGLDAGIEEILKSTVTNYINAELKSKLEVWRAGGIIKPTGKEENAPETFHYMDNNFANQFYVGDIYEVAFNYVVNTMVANMNIQQLFIGDPANFYKPSKSDATDIDRAISTFDNQGKRLAGDNAGKTQYANSPGDIFNLLVIKDNNVTASNYNYVKELFGEEFASAYQNVNSSDAQEYTTLEEHLNLLLGEGKVTEIQYNEILDTYSKTGKVKSKYKKVVLNPTKPVYVNNINRNGVNARLYVKSSSIPLLKEFTVGTPLDTLRVFMEENNIQRVAYESAVKVGLPTNVINVFEGDNIVIPTNWKDSVISNIPREGHGNQQEVPYSEEKQEVNDGTQQSKLLFTNLLTVDGFINPFTGEKVVGRELANEYLTRYEALFKGKYKQLVEDLQYDATTGRIGNLGKLKKILIDEGLSRNYSTNDIASFELNDILGKFEVPLWLNNSDSKIVALLNSIVDNRVRKRKFKGKSFVLAAPSGVKVRTLQSSDESNIIKVGDWNGELKGAVNKDGVMTYAEVLLPFKFWDNAGNLLKVEDFLNLDNTLDLTRIPEKALEIFGYRIPTSGVNLISTIKVVGFLPSAMGDVVIAPEEFIVQMGSDFDVDKLYTHMYNTNYNIATKTIEIIDSNLKGNIDNIKASIKILNTKIKELNKNPNKTEEDNLAIDELKSRLELYKNAEVLKLEDIDEMVIQNELLDIHKAVLNNPAKEVQYARNRPLSFGQLPSLAKEIFKQADTRYFSPLRNSYQLFKYSSARAGKTAVGIFSLDMVFNSVLQYVQTPLDFVTREEVDGVEKVSVVSYNIAGQRTVSLNAEKTTTGRFKSEVLEAFMTAALDNEKEQLLGKLNINNGTFNTIRAMVLLGFEEDVIISIINQPIIKAYVNDAAFKAKVEEESLTDEYKSILASISVKELKENTQGTKNDTLLQKSVLALFLDLQRKGAQLKVIQSAINSDSAGIGKNMFYSLEKANQILSIPQYDSSIPGISQVIGDYQVLDNPTTYKEDRERLLEEGYYQYKGVYIKPNSIGGFAAVYATLFNNELWTSLYPYGKQDLTTLLDYSLSGRKDLDNDSIAKKADIRQESVVAYKSLLASGAFNQFYDYASITEARKDILFDTNIHLSLGSIIHDLKRTGKYNNALLDRLQIGRGNVNIDTTGKIPTDINYYNALTLEMDEEVIINSIIDMIVNETELGIYNGQILTSKILIDKLITHQIITGGVQKSGQFIKYIPFKYLQQKGYYNRIESISDLTLDSESLKFFASILRTQNIQHNPDAYYSKFIDEKSTISGNVAVIDDEFIKLTGGFIIKEGVNDTYRIFKYNENVHQFVEIDNLGRKGVLEYDFSQNFAGRSSIYMNQVGDITVADTGTQTKENTIEAVPNDGDVANFLRLDRNNTEDTSPLIYNAYVRDFSKKYYLTDNSLSIEDKYRLILKEIKDTNSNPIVQYFAEKMSEVTGYLADVPLYVDNKLKAKGVSRNTELLGEPIHIRINPNSITSEEEMQNVLLEEMIHSLLKSELGKSSESSRKLSSLFTEVQSIAINKYGKDAFEKMQDKVKNRLPLKEGVEVDILYPLLNIDEFVAASIKNKTFQEFLNNTEATYTTKSLWSKFIEAIKTLLEKLGVKKDSNLEAVLHETLNLFDKVNAQVYKDVVKPKYVRTIEYLNNRFSLVDEQRRLLSKGNATEIANFINKHVVNVFATVVDNKVELSSNTLKDFESNYSPDIEFEDDGGKGNFTNYNTALDIRIKRLESNIKKAKQVKDFTKAAQLSEVLLKDKETKEALRDIESLVILSDKANQDLELVDKMLSRPMSSEDIVYARHIVDFWKKSKEMLFDSRAYSSDPLRRLYGSIEGSAELRGDKLFSIEKRHMEEYIKKYTGKDVNLDKEFADFKDINFLQGKVRDISTYDSKLLDSIWLSVKTANIQAVDEGTKLLEDFDKQLEVVLPVLKGLGTQEPFDIFRQRTESGKYTTHLVNPFSHKYYKDRSKILNSFLNNNNKTGLQGYVKWLKDNALNTKLSLIFPPNGVETAESKQAKLELQVQMGVGTYNYWYKQQARKIQRYEENKQGYLDYLLERHNVSSLAELESNPQEYQEAKNSYDFWIERNSPYNLEAIVFEDKKIIDIKNFNLNKYFEVAPKSKDYIDENYKVIESNPALLNFYQSTDNILDELKQYIPESQQKTLAYSGIPAIEKSLFEMYNAEGLKLGFKPIYDTFISSMQTSFSSASVSSIDPVTGKPINEMRIPLIKDNYKEIQEYVELKSSEYIIANGKQPSTAVLKEFEEEAVDMIAKSNSFDLGKIVKVYSALVLAHKHKAKIEDGVNIAQNILNSYQEVLTRPDGSVVTNAQTGVVQRKSKADSFPATKVAVDNYVKNIMYGDVKEEEGKGKTILTASEKTKKAEIVRMLAELEVQRDANLISDELYKSTKDSLDSQLADIGKTFIYSKAGDNILQYVQLKLMGWNILGGISNMGFGYISNTIEGAGGQLYTNKDLRYAYKLVTNSMLKNATFNKVETDTAKKIREGMNKWDILKDASHELYSASIPNSFGKHLKVARPYNMNQRTEYINQAPIFIAIARNTEVETPKGKINLWDGYDADFNWKAEYGEEPKDIVNKVRIKIDQVIKRNHGNYDNLSPLAVKRTFTGRAISQFRTWLYESVAVRVEKERYDSALDIYVKGRYRSVGTVYSNTNIGALAKDSLLALLKNYTFGLVDNSKSFNNLVDGEKIKDVDAANMRKVVKEVSLAINTYIFLLLLSSLKGDDDDNKVANILFNQGTRLKTDLLLYVNPMEARNIVRDLVPSFMLMKDISDWFESVGYFISGEDTVQTGVHAGDSRIGASSVKMLPFGAKLYSIYNSASQTFEK